MLVLLGVSTLASLVASLVLGVRLLRLAHRTRELPELLMGSAFISAGVVGYVLMLAGTGGAQAMPAEIAERLFLAGYAFISVGVVLTYLFVWRVFRASSKLARGFVALACLAVAATALPFALPGLGGGGGPEGAFETTAFWLGHASRVACGAWGTAEAARYFAILRRRLRLGLADPVVANRILLWAMASFGSVLIFASTAISNADGSSMDDVMSAGQILLISSVTFTVAAAQWLAFLPPRWYQARLAGSLAPPCRLPGTRTGRSGRVVRRWVRFEL